MIKEYLERLVKALVNYSDSVLVEEEDVDVWAFIVYVHKRDLNKVKGKHNDNVKAMVDACKKLAGPDKAGKDIVIKIKERRLE